MGGKVEYVKGKGKVIDVVESGIMTRIGGVYVVGTDNGFKIFNRTEAVGVLLTGGLLPRKHEYKGKETATIWGPEGGEMIVRPFRGKIRYGIVDRKLD